MKKKTTPKKKEAKIDRTKAFVLKKFMLRKVAEWLSFVTTNPGDPQKEKHIPLALHGPKARARNRIYKLVLDKANEINSEVMDLTKAFAIIDKDGKPEANPKSDQYNIDPTKKEAFDAEFLTLMKEDVVYDILPANTADWKLVRELLTTEMQSEFTVEETMFYEEICEALEALKL